MQPLLEYGVAAVRLQNRLVAGQGKKKPFQGVKYLVYP